jgi:hypothetical protein
VTDRAPDPLAPETPVPPRTAAAPRWLRNCAAAIALGFLMLPPLLALAGVSGGPLERERTASAPRLSDGWKAFDELADYVTQKLPFRAEGVDANTWIANNVWGRRPDYGTSAPGKALPFESVQAAGGGGYNQTGGAANGNPVVSIGRNGWYFLQGEFDTLCHPAVGIQTAVERWTSFVDTIRKSGRKVVLVVVPEKSTVYPEQVRPGAPNWDCARAHKRQLWRALDAQKDPDIIPLLDPLLQRKRQDPSKLLYLPLNTHWNFATATLVPQAALRRLGGPVQMRPQDLRTTRIHYDSDIGAFAGKPHAGEMGPSVDVKRPAGAPTRRERVLFLHDSFGDPSVKTLPEYAPHIVLAQWVQNSPDQIARLIRAADTVIVETVERDFFNRATNPGHEKTVLTPGFLRELPSRLAR